MYEILWPQELYPNRVKVDVDTKLSGENSPHVLYFSCSLPQQEDTRQPLLHSSNDSSNDSSNGVAAYV